MLEEIFVFTKGKFQGQMVIPVNGETEYNEPGLSHGFQHFKSATTNEKVGFCGVNYWAQNTKPYSPRN